MKQLIIIGARGFGREITDFSKDCIGYGEEFVIKGFLDDNDRALDGFSNYPKILDSVENYKIQKNDVFICGLGSVKWTQFYVSLILSKGGVFINLIHKNAVLRNNVNLGNGIIICQGSIVSTDVVIGNYSQIMSYCVIGHDVIIGKFCRLGDYVFIGGNTIINDSVFVAVKSTVLEKLEIEEESTLGAGSVVIRNVKKGTTVFGNPAKKIEC